MNILTRNFVTGFGFVMSAMRVSDSREVAVKFIYRAKIPSHSWIRDRAHGMLPMELYILLRVAAGGGHRSIIGFHEYFQDEMFFVVVTEMHGSPWSRKPKTEISPAATSSQRQPLAQLPINRMQNVRQTAQTGKKKPDLKVNTAPVDEDELDEMDDCASYHSSQDGDYTPPVSASSSDVEFSSEMDVEYPTDEESEEEEQHQEVRMALKRDSHDLFEMIETRKNLSERQVRYMMRQIVDALWYLDSLGIYRKLFFPYHSSTLTNSFIKDRDIKDENILVDDSLNIKLIDFGSAVILPPSTPLSPSSSSPGAHTKPRLFHKFYGTLQYAPVEVLQSQPYDAEKCDVWALGILVYTCLTGQTPFRSPEDAIHKQWDLLSKRHNVSLECQNFLDMCLQKDARRRATIDDLARSRWWLTDLP